MFFDATIGYLERNENGPGEICFPDLPVFKFGEERVIRFQSRGGIFSSISDPLANCRYEDDLGLYRHEVTFRYKIEGKTRETTSIMMYGTCTLGTP